MDPKALTPEQRAEAMVLLLEGRSQSYVARKIGCTQPTISRLAKEEGISNIDTRTEQMTRAKRDYDLADRLELGNKAFDKMEALLEGIQDTNKMYQWSLSFGILTDKRRLEEGQVTSRSEINTNGAIDDLEFKLEQLAARKRQELSVN